MIAPIISKPKLNERQIHCFFPQSNIKSSSLFEVARKAFDPCFHFRLNLSIFWSKANGDDEEEEGKDDDIALLQCDIFVHKE